MSSFAITHTHTQITNTISYYYNYYYYTSNGPHQLLNKCIILIVATHLLIFKSDLKVNVIVLFVATNLYLNQNLK